jgi:hypothetical protein
MHWRYAHINAMRGDRVNPGLLGIDGTLSEDVVRQAMMRINETQGLEWLNKEVEKDKMEIQNHKNQMINEIKKMDKTEMFKPKPKNKVSIINKILKILGYGKKG